MGSAKRTCNTFDEKVAQNVVNISPYKIIDERIVEIMPLSKILNIYLPKAQEIDFLSIDIEGRDFDVLKSNDRSRYIPLEVLVQYHSGFNQKDSFFFDEVLNSEIKQYLQSKGFTGFAKTLNTIFFIFKSNTLKTNLKVFTD